MEAHGGTASADVRLERHRGGLLLRLGVFIVLLLAARLRSVVIRGGDLALAHVSTSVVQTVTCVIHRAHTGLSPQLTLEVHQPVVSARTSLLSLDLLVPVLCEGLLLELGFVVLQELLLDQWLGCHGGVCTDLRHGEHLIATCRHDTQDYGYRIGSDV